MMLGYLSLRTPGFVRAARNREAESPASKTGRAGHDGSILEYPSEDGDVRVTLGNGRRSTIG